MNKISVAVMCADLMNLSREIKELSACGVDYFHIDIMDGSFVPNIAIGIDVAKKIGVMSPIPRDIHLQVNYPEKYADILDLKNKDMVTLHYECMTGSYGMMDKVKALGDVIGRYKGKGCSVGIAINPETPVAAVRPFISKINHVTIMMVHPGFKNTMMLDGMLNKVSDMKKFLTANGGANVKIEVDGNVNFTNAMIMKKNGGDIFVGGSASVFSKGMDRRLACVQLRNAIC